MSTVFYDTTFEALIETLADYYGTSSIGWQEVSAAGFTNEAIIDSINGIPGYHAVQNSDGTVRMYRLSDETAEQEEDICGQRRRSYQNRQSFGAHNCRISGR